MTGTLRDRINEAEQQRVADARRLQPEPVPFVAPWRRRLIAKDMTDSLLYNGAVVPAGDRGTDR